MRESEFLMEAPRRTASLCRDMAPLVCALGTIFRHRPVAAFHQVRHEENHVKKLIVFIALTIALSGISQAGSKKELETPAFDKALAQQMIDNSIQRFELAEGIGVEDAIASMELRANMLNFKLVADLPLSEQVKAMGQEANYMRILAFCDAPNRQEDG